MFDVVCADKAFLLAYITVFSVTLKIEIKLHLFFSHVLVWDVY